ncbi:MAG: Nif3-like dinuclear metal center hexameric protein [Gammaproteobacteria bacterium]|nr:Nif3-like dinuclear metal center hexameric protein [Gammaproteobacteria bacterium]
MQRSELLTYLDGLLDVAAFKDYGPNGLQVEGSGQVKHIVSGVTASQALIEAAIERGADTLLVHHGYFWKGEDPRIIGMKYRRIKALLDHDINLLGYHLPLDAHPQLGNNAQLAQCLGFTADGGFGRDNGPDIGLYGALNTSMAGEQLASHIETVLGRKPLYIAGHERAVKTIAWCTGGAQSYIEQAADLGVDAYLSGEISEYTVHIARELGIHFYAAGHHATERYGVMALGQHLSEKFDLQHEFVDIGNPA